MVKLFLIEDARILGIETEHQPHAKYIQSMVIRIGRLIAKFRKERIVNFPNQFARLKTYFFFAANAFALTIDKEL